MTVLLQFPTPTQKRYSKFISLLAAAVATTFAQLGAMSVKIAVLNAFLKAMSIAFLAVALSAIAIFMRTRRGVLN
jgi:hypothetical protein